MGRPSQLLSDRYQIQLSESWQNWFDGIGREVSLPGFFRQQVDLAGLCASKPTQIWSGFMLPDTLPVLSNGYGDWICVRVRADGSFGELLHWYHGGGDWIPVGQHLAEAILHDAVDVHRPIRKQMLRGAVETARPKNSSDRPQALQQWLVDSIVAVRDDLSQDAVLKIVEAAQSGHYAIALKLLVESQLAFEAAVCDNTEQMIQQAVPSEHGSLNMLEDEDCNRIAELCESIIERRQDLGWAYSLLGWCQQHAGNKELSKTTFFSGRFASAFSDQSVRLRLHRFEQRYGKFSIAQLAASRKDLPESITSDEYLTLYLNNRDANLVSRVQDYWLNLAQSALASGDHSEAYRLAYNAGWDIGATSMPSYRKILDILYQSSKAAGWAGRSAVAKAHLDAI